MKKKLVLFIALNSFFINAQVWRNYSSGNDFDGKYKTSSITGNASNYPYNKPNLVINHFEKDDSINFYIIDAGYFSDSSNVEILWVFNNEKDVIYETSSRTISADGKSIFLIEFKSPKSGDFLSVYDFINKLKNASSISVRVKGKYDNNDIKFSLKGSTKAINYVISAKEIEQKIEQRNYKIKLAEEIKKGKDKRKDSLLNLAKVIKSKLIKISLNPSLAVNKISRNDFIGEKVKFLKKNGSSEYQRFGQNERAYPYLKYENFNGRIATIIDLKKNGNSMVEYIYKLELVDNKEIVYLKLYDYSEFPDEIGFISLLEDAREKYLGKTLYRDQYSLSEIPQDFDMLQECIITKITFAEDDGKYSQLHGAFNVYYETKGTFNKYIGFHAKSESKMINVIFSNTYSPVDGYEFGSKEENIFENIFYYIEESGKPKIKELEKVNKLEKVVIGVKELKEEKEIEKLYKITTSNGEIIESDNYKINKKKKIIDIQKIDGKIIRINLKEINSIKQNGRELLIK